MAVTKPNKADRHEVDAVDYRDMVYTPPVRAGEPLWYQLGSTPDEPVPYAVVDVPSTMARAESLIHGDRQDDYGNPLENMTRIAAFWNAYRGGKAGDLTAEDVAVMLCLLKISRLAKSPDHVDSAVDAMGYLGIIELIRNERAKG